MMSCTWSGTRKRIDSPRAHRDRTRVAPDVEGGYAAHVEDVSRGGGPNCVGVVTPSCAQHLRDRPVPRKHRGAGALGHDDVGKRRNAFEVDPGIESRNRIHSQDQTQRRAGEFLAHGLQTCPRSRWGREARVRARPPRVRGCPRARPRADACERPRSPRADL